MQSVYNIIVFQPCDSDVNYGYSSTKIYNSMLLASFPSGLIFVCEGMTRVAQLQAQPHLAVYDLSNIH